jgi:lysosomal acid phosphatase
LNALAHHCPSQNYAITSQKQWAAVCSAGLGDDWAHIGSQNAISSTIFAVLAAIFLLGMFILSKFIKSSRAKAHSSRIRLADDEVSQSHLPQTQYPNYGALSNVRSWYRAFLNRADKLFPLLSCSSQNVIAQPAPMGEKQRLAL